MYVDFILDIFDKNKEKTAIVYKENNYSYDWLLDSYNQWKSFLSMHSIPNNSVVSLLADFSPYSIGMLLALIDIGSIFVPLSPAVKNPDDLMSIAECEFCIRLVNQTAYLEKRNSDTNHELLLKLKELKHPGLILFSSGTTGKPKAAVHDLVPLMQKFKIPGKTLKSITFLLFDHIGGFNTLMHNLSNAGTIIVIENRSPEEVCRLIEKYNVELLPTSPTFLNMILFSRAYEQYNISCLKMVTYGTEPMPEATLNNFHNLFPDVQMKQTYGLSEIGIMRSKSESSNSLFLKVGGEDYQTKIVDGKLWINAKTAMLGYLNAPSPFDIDGWFNTGDRVEQKGEYIRFLGRESEIINVGGEKVYPIEVESVLLEFDGVKDAAVHGESHPLMGNIVVAAVTVDEENNNKEFVNKIKAFCKLRLQKYKIPVKINLCTRAFNSDRFKRIR